MVPNPTAIYTSGTLPAGTDSIKYLVTATTAEGCKASDEIIVRVFKTGPSIFVPSGFTPNSDGLNDQLRPILAGMRGLHFFRIYNRYGQLIFETRELRKGWNGLLNGMPQASGTYVFHCQAETFEGKMQSAKGSFMLIR
jgi:gliding motility-associated-like protein